MNQEKIFSKVCNVLYPSSNINEIKRTYNYIIIKKFINYINQTGLNDTEIEILLTLIRNNRKIRLSKLLSDKFIDSLIRKHINNRQMLINDLLMSKNNYNKMHQHDLKYLYETAYVSINYIAVSKKCTKEALKNKIIPLDDLFNTRKHIYQILSFNELHNILQEDLIYI